MSEKINVWIRLGVTISVTKDELDKLLGSNQVVGASVIERHIENSEFIVDGESYIPFEVVDGINKKLGTNYDCDDYDFEF